jgi:hypothetical protein
MRNLPTKQKLHARNKDPTLQNHRARERSPFHTDRNGLDHRTTLIAGIRRNIDYCGPWMLTRGYLSTLQNNDHRTPNHPIVLQTHIPLVRTTHKGNIRQRPPFYESLWTRSGQRTGHYVEHVDGVPPTNGWANRAQEPVAETIPPIGSR